MRDLYIVCVRICNQYSYIHRITIVKRSVYWGGGRDSKEATEGKADFKIETKHYSVLAKLINK